MVVNRKLQFDTATQARIHRAARALNTTQRELVQWCVLQGLDELEGLAREAAQRTYREAR